MQIIQDVYKLKKCIVCGSKIDPLLSFKDVKNEYYSQYLSEILDNQIKSKTRYLQSIDFTCLAENTDHEFRISISCRNNDKDYYFWCDIFHYYEDDPDVIRVAGYMKDKLKLQWLCKNFKITKDLDDSFSLKDFLTEYQNYQSLIKFK